MSTELHAGSCTLKKGEEAFRLAKKPYALWTDVGEEMVPLRKLDKHVQSPPTGFFQTTHSKRWGVLPQSLKTEGSPNLEMSC